MRCTSRVQLTSRRRIVSCSYSSVDSSSGNIKMSSKSAVPPRKQLFKEEYCKRWKCIVKSRRDQYSVRCTVCECDFSVSHGGANDIQAHMKSKKHKSQEAGSSGTSNIAAFFQPKDNKVIRAETLMAQFLIEHNIPFSVSDHFTSLTKKMFPDSVIASKFASRRTKATAIGKTLGQDAKSNIIHKLRVKPFSLSTDGSSDRAADEQLYPIVVRFYDDEVKRVVSALLQIATTKENSTGRNIFELLNDVLKQCSIPWKNAICFGADNAAVMLGIHKGVAAFVKKENPNIFVLGCPCHLLHLAAEKGAAELPVTPADTLTAIYYYLEKSSKRSKEFKEVQKLCCLENHAILKHVCTRWMSLQQSLDRLLEQWVALLEYFRKEAQIGSDKKQTAGSCPPKKQKLGVGNSSVAAKKTQPLLHSSKKSSVHTAARSDSAGASQALKSVPSASCSRKTPADKDNPPKKGIPSSSRGSGKIMPQASLFADALSGTGKSHARQATAPLFGGSKSGPTSRKQTNPVGASNTSAQIGKLTPKLKSKVSAPASEKSQPLSGSTSSGKETSQLRPGTQSTMKRKSWDESSQMSSEIPVSKAASIYYKLVQEKNKLYCLFLQHTIPVFNYVNLELQEEAPKIHVMLDILQELLHQLQLRFVQPEMMLDGKMPDKRDFKCRKNQREDGDLIVGTKVREFLSSGKLSDEEKTEFYSSVRKYYVTSCNYIVTKFPLQDDVLKHARVAKPANRVAMTYSSVEYFVNRFQLDGIDRDALELEFASYQVDTLDGVILDGRVDVVWTQISNMENKSSGSKKYLNLSRVMLTILSLAHSNATDERIFSLVRKNATEFRPSLATPTISDFLTQKVWCQAMGKACHEMTFSDQLLEKCKKATNAYNTKTA